MKAQELRDQSVEELELKEKELNRDLFTLINELKLSKKIEKPHLVREKRKEIARIKTVLREKR